MGSPELGVLLPGDHGRTGHQEVGLPGLPATVEAQIAAFAQEISFFESEEAFGASQADNELKFASQSFIPSGLFSPEGESTSPPEALAIFTGQVLEAALLENSLTGTPYYWALVEALGGHFDVVADWRMLESSPAPGGVISGSFWLSGRLTIPPTSPISPQPDS